MGKYLKSIEVINKSNQFKILTDPFTNSKPVQSNEHLLIADERILKVVPLAKIQNYLTVFPGQVFKYHLKLALIHIPSIVLLLHLAFQANLPKPLYFTFTFLVGVLIWSYFELSLKAKTSLRKKLHPEIVKAEELAHYLELRSEIKRAEKKIYPPDSSCQS